MMLTAALYMNIGPVAGQADANAEPHGSGSGHWKIVKNSSDVKESIMIPIKI